MPCMNHPEVMDGLSPCTKCGKSYCIDCLVGRQSGWFCSGCDTEAPAAPPVAAAVPMAAAPPPAPAVVSLSPRPAVVKSCANHPDVIDGLNPCSRCDRRFCPDCLVELKGGRFCAGCKLDAVKDLQSGVDGTGLQLASIGQRFVAHIIDTIVTYAAMIVFMFIIGMIMAVAKPGNDSALAPILGCGVMLVFFSAFFCYNGFMLQARGQTLGKMAMKIKVVTPEGGPISAGQAWIRVIVWALLQGFIITYIPAFFNKDRTTIHDMAARTRVVKVG